MIKVGWVSDKNSETAEELEKEKQSANYCSILGDGLCVPEENEQMVKQNLTKELDKEVK